MRRTIAIMAAMAAATAMTLAMATVALADGGPHGGFGPSARGTSTGWSNTDGCAGCHRAHTGTNTYLLTTATEEALCESCHRDGVGAGTDVFNGVYVASGNPAVRHIYDGTPGAGLNGGGFDFAPKYVDGSTTPTTRVAVTSEHTIGGTGIAWGGGMASGSGNTGPGYTGTLECSSCHNPHGSNNYRMLNSGTAWVTSAPRLEDGIVRTNELERLDAKKYTAGLNTAYDSGISDFCASCHTNYLLTRNWAGNVNGGSGQMYDWDNDGTAENTWRHSVASKYRYTWDSGTNSWVTSTGHSRTSSALKTAYEYHLRGATATSVATSSASFGNFATTSGQLTCLTCHFAHGTAASATGFAQNAGKNGGSAILFLDNRGVCQNCHGVGN